MQDIGKKSNQFLVQGSILAAASIIVRLIGLMYRIPLDNIIGPEGMGSYGFAFEIYHIALILSSYSLPIAVSKLVAVRRNNKEYRNAYRVFKCAMIVAIFVGLTASLILFFGAKTIAQVSANDVSVALPLRVLAPTIFVFSIMGVLRGFFQGKNTMIPTAVSQILEQIINAIVSIVAAYFLIKTFSGHPNVASYGAAGGTLGTLLGAIAGFLFLVFVFIIYRPVQRKKLRKDTTTYEESYGTIIKLLLLTILPIVLSQTVYHISGFIDYSLFANIMASKEVTSFDLAVVSNPVPGQLYTDEIRKILIGIYSNRYRLLTNVPVAIASAFGAALIPSIAAANIKNMGVIIKHKIHSAIKLNMIIAFPAAVGLAVLSDPILTMLFRENTGLATNFFRLGSIAVVFYALSTVTNAILQGVNRMRIPVIHAGISLGIHVILVFLLLKFTHLSTYALIIGNVTFPLVICILNWIAIEKYLDYQQEIIKSFIIPAISAGLMGVVSYFTYYVLNLLTGINTLAVLVAMTIAVIFYFTILIFLKGLEEEEILYLPKGVTLIRIFKRLRLL